MRWLAVLVWMLVILIFSTDYFSDARTTALLFTSSTGDAIRKLAHWGEYFVLAVLLIRAQNGKSTGIISKRRILIAVTFAALYAAIDEWHQSFVPSRDARARDVLIDAIGAACGASLFYAYAAMKRVKTVHANTRGGRS
jgi:VanZ family protein